MPKERQHRRPWTQQEDQLLKRAISIETPLEQKPEWKKIAFRLEQLHPTEFPRNPKQCRERWFNTLDPGLSEHRWGRAEDVKLLQACQKQGHRWSKIASQFDFKVNDNQLKNHFYSNLRKVVRHLNILLKNQKQAYSQQKSSNPKIDYEPNQLMAELSKVRTFDIKLLTKIFSLIDYKQDGKYQAKHSIQIEQITKINQQFLELMIDFISEKNQLPKIYTLHLILTIVQINKSIKAKYIRQSKLSLQEDDEISRTILQRKKFEKKINSIVKNEFENKIIPSKQEKFMVLEKMKEDNEKIDKLLRIIKRKERKNRSGDEIREDKEEEGRNQDEQANDKEMSSEEEGEWRKNYRIIEPHINSQSLLGQSKNIQQCFDFSQPDPILQNSISLYLDQGSRIKQRKVTQEPSKPFSSNFLNCIMAVDPQKQSVERTNKVTEAQGCFDFTKNFAIPLFGEKSDKNDNNCYFYMENSPLPIFRENKNKRLPLGTQVQELQQQPISHYGSLLSVDPIPSNSNIEGSRQIFKSSELFGHRLFNSHDFDSSKQLDNDFKFDSQDLFPLYPECKSPFPKK